MLDWEQLDRYHASGFVFRAAPGRHIARLCQHTGTQVESRAEGGFAGSRVRDNSRSRMDRR
jgi:hypothetical protein